ncbi:uncharacterized protein BO97DRAFT_409203 [Aspergillus homomorphus CBS 101889]|uniref:Secreted protein n=1 Tax=Aspergillus homomorphus (strain CBS 101889) TaxID=1450537 RepID=A0A395HH04_ASPHC|nr:hypothetical protein BO97DRAFT_409203 [Aspergillus homomorphus CBS 101889]RAL07181.1 hypothetical protein BO97DRAFT_409203 [Aspergillus homomorphus CBS 101889]
MKRLGWLVFGIDWCTFSLWSVVEQRLTPSVPKGWSGSGLGKKRNMPCSDAAEIWVPKVNSPGERYNSSRHG